MSVLDQMRKWHQHMDEAERPANGRVIYLTKEQAGTLAFDECSEMLRREHPFYDHALRAGDPMLTLRGITFYGAEVEYLHNKPTLRTSYAQLATRRLHGAVH